MAGALLVQKDSIDLGFSPLANFALEPLAMLPEAGHPGRTILDTSAGLLAVDDGTDMRYLAPLDSPAFTDLPTAPTPPAGNSSTRLATTEFVTVAVAAEAAARTAADDAEEAARIASDDAEASARAAADSTLQDNIDDEASARAAADAALASQIDERLPSGCIVLWSGPEWNIPSGWRLCNGANGTPDLRNRFVVGAGSTYSPGNTGGSDTLSQVPNHSHDAGTLAADSGGAHAHTFSGSVGSGGAHTHQVGGYRPLEYDRTGTSAGVANLYNWGSANIDDIATSSEDGAHTHSISGTIASGGAHSHDVSGNTGTTGAGSSVDIRPRYYALCYIMKT